MALVMETKHGHWRIREEGRREDSICEATADSGDTAVKRGKRCPMLLSESSNQTLG